MLTLRRLPRQLLARVGSSSGGAAIEAGEDDSQSNKIIRQAFHNVGGAAAEPDYAAAATEAAEAARIIQHSSYRTVVVEAATEQDVAVSTSPAGDICSAFDAAASAQVSNEATGEREQMLHPHLSHYVLKVTDVKRRRSELPT